MGQPGHGQQLWFACSVGPPPASAAPALLTSRPATTCPDNQNFRVNVHFMQHSDGTGNFTATDDGKPCNPDPANNGYAYAQSLVYGLNDHMAKNPVLRIPPVIP